MTIKKSKIGEGYYLQEGITEDCNVLINGKNFYDQPIDSDIKRYKEIRRLKISRGDN